MTHLFMVIRDRLASVFPMFCASQKLVHNKSTSNQKNHMYLFSHMFSLYLSLTYKTPLKNEY